MLSPITALTLNGQLCSIHVFNHSARTHNICVLSNNGIIFNILGNDKQ